MSAYSSTSIWQAFVIVQDGGVIPSLSYFTESKKQYALRICTGLGKKMRYNSLKRIELFCVMVYGSLLWSYVDIEDDDDSFLALVSSQWSTKTSRHPSNNSPKISVVSIWIKRDDNTFNETSSMINRQAFQEKAYQPVPVNARMPAYKTNKPFFLLGRKKERWVWDVNRFLTLTRIYGSISIKDKKQMTSHPFSFIIIFQWR